MKKIFAPLALVALFTACKQKDTQTTTTKEVVFADTNRIVNNVNADTAKTTAPVVAPPPVAAPAHQPQVIVKYVPMPAPAPKASQTKIVRTPTNTKTNPPVVTNTPAPQPDVSTAPSTSDNGTSASTGSTASAPAPVETKKGPSNATKGAIIGGVGGAVAGAVIGKGGKGAVIGGVVGAAGGYILGKQKDKKTQQQTTPAVPNP